MGIAKHTLLHSQSKQTLLQQQLSRLSPHFQETYLLGAAPSLDLSFAHLPDPQEYMAEGPLVGLLNLLETSKEPWVALLACDYPNVTAELFQVAFDSARAEDDAVVFCDVDQRPQWLCALYRKRLSNSLRDALMNGTRAVKDFATTFQVRYVNIPKEVGAEILFNLNCPADAKAQGFELPI